MNSGRVGLLLPKLHSSNRRGRRFTNVQQGIPLARDTDRTQTVRQHMSCVAEFRRRVQRNLQLRCIRARRLGKVERLSTLDASRRELRAKLLCQLKMPVRSQV